MYNLWIVRQPKTWSCTQLASCSSLQWVLVPTMKKCINLYSKCPCQLINHFITRCQFIITLSPDVNFTLRFSVSQSLPTWFFPVVSSQNPPWSKPQRETHGKKFVNPQRKPEEIDTDASGFISPDEILEHTSNPAVWLGWLGFWQLAPGFQKAFFGSFLGSFLFFGTKKRLVDKHTEKIRKKHLPFVVGNFWKKSYWTKRFGFTNKNQAKQKGRQKPPWFGGRGLDGGWKSM